MSACSSPSSPPLVYVCLQCGEQSCESHSACHVTVPRSDSHCLSYSVSTGRVRCFSCGQDIPFSSCKKLSEAAHLIGKRFANIPAPSVAKVDNTTVKSSGSTVDFAKIKSRPTVTSPRGLINTGNTCYLNAVLQSLSQCAPLTGHLPATSRPGYTLSLPPPAAADRQQPAPPLELQAPCGPLTATFCSLLAQLTAPASPATQSPVTGAKKGRQPSHQQAAVHPGTLLRQIAEKAPQFSGNDQQDSQELLRTLIDLLRQEEIKRRQTALLSLFGLSTRVRPDTVPQHVCAQLKALGKRAAHTPVDQIFGGLLICIVECQSCHDIWHHCEPFYDLSLPVVEDKPDRPRRNGATSPASDGEYTLPQRHKPAKATKMRQKKGRGKNRHRRTSGSTDMAAVAVAQDEEVMAEGPGQEETVGEESGSVRDDSGRQSRDGDVEDSDGEHLCLAALFTGPDSDSDSVPVASATPLPAADSSVTSDVTRVLTATQQLGGVMARLCLQDSSLSDNVRAASAPCRPHSAASCQNSQPCDVTTAANSRDLAAAAAILSECGDAATLHQRAAADCVAGGSGSCVDTSNRVADHVTETTAHVTVTAAHVTVTADHLTETADNLIAAAEEVESGAAVDCSAAADIPVTAICSEEGTATVNTASGSAERASVSADVTNASVGGIAGSTDGTEGSTQRVGTSAGGTEGSTVRVGGAGGAEGSTERVVCSAGGAEGSTVRVGGSGGDVSHPRHLATVAADDAVCVSRHWLRQAGQWLAPSGRPGPSAPAAPSGCSVLNSLGQFTAPELLAGSNRLICESCTKQKQQQQQQQQRVGAGAASVPVSSGAGRCVYSSVCRQLLVYSAPPVLTLHLKRFQIAGGALRKVNRHVQFDTRLDLAPFCSSKVVQSSLRYSLFAVVEHTGRLTGGHYTAYVLARDRPTAPSPACTRPALAPFIPLLNGRLQQCSHTSPDTSHRQQLEEEAEQREAEEEQGSVGGWFHISDTQVRSVSLQQVLSCQAYLLFYERAS